jgi:hypothetical protein
MTPLPIDLDAEAIQFEGQWYTRDELARKIKSMLDSGDFAVGKPSQALEQLNQTVAALRTLAFRVTPEMADAINAISAKHGRGVGSIIREALAMHLGLPPTPDVERMPPKRTTAPTGRRQTEPELSLPVTAAPAVVQPPPPPPLLTPPLPPDLKATQQMAMPPQVIAGPGALKSGGLSPHTPPPHPMMPPPPPAAAIQPPTIIVEKSALEPVAGQEAAGSSGSSSGKKADDDGIERRWFSGS